MMPKHGRLYVFFLMLFVSGQMSAKEPPIYLQYANEIIRSFSNEIEKEYGFTCIGSGGGMSHDVEEISVQFIAYRRASIEKARELEVKATEKLLRMINDHEKIRPFLREYPFKTYRVEVSIAFNKVDNSAFTDGSVAYVSKIRDKIFYYKATLVKEDLVKLYEEPYEEAVKIVKENPLKKDSPVQHPI
ncbi:MAG: hypothetical protein WCP39_00385 [Chlamydiota bacterium]